ncbi:MAG TPA: hypothetical protein VFE58_14300 [Tepidisphaeraceae bacterium]|jgi:hypothetical protein|nr:hypothetical protein [Tepidisphaeraceae bacterium]
MPNPKFSCTACGRQFTWKPSIAGKSAKCSCGAIIQVPTEIAAEEEDDAALYELAAAAEVAAPIHSAAPIAMPSVAPAAKSIAYANPRTAAKPTDRFTAQNLIDPTRDIYVPIALLVAGFLLAIVWGFHELHSGANTLFAVSFVMTLNTLVKTVVVTGLALLFAPMLGVSFGTLGTGTLKFASILIFTDAVNLWLEALLHAAGATPTHGHTVVRVPFTVSLFLSVAIITGLCYYLFSMDGSETRMFAVPLALVSRLIDWALQIFLLGIIVGMHAAQHPAPPPTPVIITPPAATTPDTSTPSPDAGGVPTTAPTTAPVQPAAITPTKFDQFVDNRIRTQKLFVQEGREWRQHQITRDNATNALIEQMYQAGAQGVYVELQGARAGHAIFLYVKLPADPDAQAACKQVADTFRQSKNLPKGMPNTNQYLVVLLPRSK